MYIFVWSVRDRYTKKKKTIQYYIETRSQINLKENRIDNQEWAIQRHMKDWVHKTRDEDKQSTKTQHRKLKRWATRIIQKLGVREADPFLCIYITIVNAYCFLGKHIDNVLYNTLRFIPWHIPGNWQWVWPVKNET